MFPLSPPFFIFALKGNKIQVTHPFSEIYYFDTFILLQDSTNHPGTKSTKTEMKSEGIASLKIMGITKQT